MIKITDLCGNIIVAANSLENCFKLAKDKGISFTNAQLQSLDLSNLDLSGLSFVGANFQYTDLTRTDLSNSRLSYTNISGANFKNTDLSNSNLSYANISGANFKNTDLNNVNFEESYGNVPRFGTNVENCCFDFAYLSYAIFDNCTFTACSFKRTIFKYVSGLHRDKNFIDCIDLHKAIIIESW